MAFLQRKKVLTEKGLQFRFSWFVIRFVLGAAALTGLVMFYTTFAILGERLAQVYPQGRLEVIFRSVYAAVILNLILIVPMIFWFSLRFSHRIAGPLPKIYRAIRQLGEGDFEVHVLLRKKDELQELAQVINQTAQKLKARQEGKAPQG